VYLKIRKNVAVAQLAIVYVQSDLGDIFVKMKELQTDDRFYKLFFNLSTISRPSCSACRFTDTYRVSDIFYII